MASKDSKISNAEAKARVIETTIGLVRLLLQTVSELNTAEELKTELKQKLELIDLYLLKTHNRGSGILP